MNSVSWLLFGIGLFVLLGGLLSWCLRGKARRAYYLHLRAERGWRDAQRLHENMEPFGEVRSSVTGGEYIFPTMSSGNYVDLIGRQMAKTGVTSREAERAFVKLSQEFEQKGERKNGDDSHTDTEPKGPPS